MQPMSQRQARVAEIIHQVVAGELARYGSASLAGAPCGVTRVWASPDLKQARVYVTSLQLGQLTPQQLVANLQENTHLLGKALGKQLTTKFTPRLTFVYDDQLEGEAKILTLLNKLRHTPTEA